jgi:hypothetical protein
MPFPHRPAKAEDAGLTLPELQGPQAVLEQEDSLALIVGAPPLPDHGDTDMLLRLAASDPAVAEVMAEYLHDFTGCDLARVERSLAVHADPSVRLALAGNGQTSRSVLVLLRGDTDPAVTTLAQQQIQRWLSHRCDQIGDGA